MLLGSTCPGGRCSNPKCQQPAMSPYSWPWAVRSLLAPQDTKGSHHCPGDSLAPREGQAGSGLQGGKQPRLLGSDRKDVLLTRSRFFWQKKGKADKNIL